MTDEKIRSAVEIAQKAIELSHRVPPEGLKKSKELMTLAHAVVELSAELAALKEKYRWRKQSEEPAPEDIKLLVCGRGRKGQAYFLVTETDGDYWHDNIGDSVSLDVDYWRPLDLPEMEETK